MLLSSLTRGPEGPPGADGPTGPIGPPGSLSMDGHVHYVWSEPWEEVTRNLIQSGSNAGLYLCNYAMSVPADASSGFSAAMSLSANGSMSNPNRTVSCGSLTSVSGSSRSMQGSVPIYCFSDQTLQLSTTISSNANSILATLDATASFLMNTVPA